MYIKGLFEVFKILGRLGIKPKDVIGMGGNVVKMGKSLFNTRVNPKLLQFVEKNQKIPTKIIEEIKIHARTLKNASENQKKLFEVNIRDILNAKTPKPPVTSVKQPATSVKDAAEAFKGWKPTVIKGGKDGLATGGRAGFDGGGSPLQQLKQEIVDSMKPYAPGVPEDQLQIIVKDITFDMSPAEAQASAKANFIKLFGMATGGIATHFRKR
tara:strand:+ start:142 stop:777 length:636 start_codon:yes stop_codon:yes gene_type:complete